MLKIVWKCLQFLNFYTIWTPIYKWKAVRTDWKDVATNAWCCTLHSEIQYLKMMLQETCSLQHKAKHLSKHFTCSSLAMQCFQEHWDTLAISPHDGTNCGLLNEVVDCQYRQHAAEENKKLANVSVNLFCYKRRETDSQVTSNTKVSLAR